MVTSEQNHSIQSTQHADILHPSTPTPTSISLLKTTITCPSSMTIDLLSLVILKRFSLHRKLNKLYWF